MPRATIVKRLTADGLCELAETVPLGKVLEVDLDTIREVRLWNLDWRVHHEKLVIQARQDPDGAWRWFPLELLKVEAQA